MTVRSNIFAVAFGVATSVAMFAAPVDAATSWVGRGTGTGTALGNWIAATPGFLETADAVPGAPKGVFTGGGFVTGTMPLQMSNPLRLTSTIGVTGGAGTLSQATPLMTGTLNTATPVRPNTAGKGINLSQFSSGLNSFGFFLQNMNLPSGTNNGTQGGPVVVTLTDSNGASTITVCGTGISGVCNGSNYGAAFANNVTSAGPLEYTGITGTGTCVNPTALDSLRADAAGTCLKSEFFGFTGISGPITSFTISGAGGVQYGIGDFFEAPEPASMAILGAGLLGLGIARRRRNAA